MAGWRVGLPRVHRRMPRSVRLRTTWLLVNGVLLGAVPWLAGPLLLTGRLLGLAWPLLLAWLLLPARLLTTGLPDGARLLGRSRLLVSTPSSGGSCPLTARFGPGMLWLWGTPRSLPTGRRLLPLSIGNLLRAGPACLSGLPTDGFLSAGRRAPLVADPTGDGGVLAARVPLSPLSRRSAVLPGPGVLALAGLSILAGVTSHGSPLTPSVLVAIVVWVLACHWHLPVDRSPSATACGVGRLGAATSSSPLPSVPGPRRGVLALAPLARRTPGESGWTPVGANVPLGPASAAATKGEGVPTAGNPVDGASPLPAPRRRLTRDA